MDKIEKAILQFYNGRFLNAFIEWLKIEILKRNNIFFYSKKVVVDILYNVVSEKIILKTNFKNW